VKTESAEARIIHHKDGSVEVAVRIRSPEIAEYDDCDCWATVFLAMGELLDAEGIRATDFWLDKRGTAKSAGLDGHGRDLVVWEVGMVEP
jgi:hypothetical protein